MRKRSGPRSGGFTLIELMVVVSIIAILGILVGPSVMDMILKERLRGINAQLVTDMQFARAEAMRLGRVARISLRTNSSQACYTIFYSVNDQPVASGDRCNCLLGAGSACTLPTTSEIKTTSVPLSSRVNLTWSRSSFGFDHVTGGLVSTPSDNDGVPIPFVNFNAYIENNGRHLTTMLVESGRPSVCTPNAPVMQVKSC